MPMPVSRTAKRSVTAVSPSSTSRYGHRDLAVLGELDGVADEVGEDWRRRPGSPRRAAGTSASTSAVSSSPLLWACRASRSQVSSTVRRRSKSSVSSSSLPASILEKSRMSLMIVSSASALFSHGARVLALLGVQVGVEQECGHADDAVHRRADLVAHVGEELALRGVRRLRLQRELVCTPGREPSSRFAASASSMALRRDFSISLRREMSHVTPVMRTGLPPASRSDAAALGDVGDGAVSTHHAEVRVVGGALRQAVVDRGAERLEIIWVDVPVRRTPMGPATPPASSRRARRPSHPTWRDRTRCPSPKRPPQPI